MDQVTASAPGSIMLFGEHAVLYGHQAMVCAVKSRVHVTVSRRADRSVVITSHIGAPLETTLDALTGDGSYRFIQMALVSMKDRLKSGVSIDITSNIDPNLGLGSSGAVTIATLGALGRLIGANPGAAHVHSSALDIVRRCQGGRASGADLAASLHGGVISYRLPRQMLDDVPVGGAAGGAEGGTAEVTPLPHPASLSLRYVGYKTPTAEVLERVAQARIGHEAAHDRIYEAMGEIAAQACDAAQAQEWDIFTNAMGAYQRQMAHLGVSDPNIEGIIAQASEAAGVAGVKISGSGLGDCVVAIGAVPPGFERVFIDPQGLRLHD